MAAPAQDEILSRSVNEWVRVFRILPSVKTRTRELTRLIGPHTDNPLVLDRRARLITALGVAGLWPSSNPRS